MHCHLIRPATPSLASTCKWFLLFVFVSSLNAIAGLETDSTVGCCRCVCSSNGTDSGNDGNNDWTAIYGGSYIIGLMLGSSALVYVALYSVVACACDLSMLMFCRGLKWIFHHLWLIVKSGDLGTALWISWVVRSTRPAVILFVVGTTLKTLVVKINQVWWIKKNKVEYGQNFIGRSYVKFLTRSELKYLYDQYGPAAPPFSLTLGDVLPLFQSDVELSLMENFDQEDPERVNCLAVEFARSSLVLQILNWTWWEAQPTVKFLVFKDHDGVYRRYHADLVDDLELFPVTSAELNIILGKDDVEELRKTILTETPENVKTIKTIRSIKFA